MSAHATARRLARVLVLVLAGCFAAAPARASSGQETIFQDDSQLLNGSFAQTQSTLDTMQALGADRIRVLVFWSRLAPAAGSRTRPPNFDATNPNSYSQTAWNAYDNVVRGAQRRGMDVDLNFAPPVPLWATQFTGDAQLADHYRPSANEFQSFVQAVGRRYDGTFAPPLAGSASRRGPTASAAALPGEPLPAVRFWSIWNEPNVWNFLAPQFASSSSPVEAAAPLYRSLVDAGYSGLVATGHGGDTILIGETAPQGTKTKGANRPGSHHSLDPLRLLRALYCVDRRFKPLQGAGAQAVGCPTTAGARASFASDHPGFFQATGWGHHPYALASSPNSRSKFPDDVKLGDLPRLTNALKSVFRAWGRGSAGLPVYLTEFGFQTRPPDPFAVSPSRQAEYINQSEFNVYGNSRVRSYSQFLLVDDGPDTRFPSSSFFYWNNFQTGLVWGPASGLEGRLKPSFSAFRIPIFIPRQQSPRAATFRVWGALRPAPNGTTQSASIQFKGRTGGFKRIQLATTSNFRNYVDVLVRITQSGVLRIAWTSGGVTLFSRSVSVKIGR